MARIEGGRVSRPKRLYLAGGIALACWLASLALVVASPPTADSASLIAALAFGLLGLVAAGLVPLYAAGHSTIDYAALWKEATRQNDMLREAVDALPAGLVIYGADERLMMFNSTAATITSNLRMPGAIGKTYAEMAHDTARRLEQAGHGPQPVDEWIERFRSKTARRTRQAEDGRWFDWSEKTTASGLTVGLRVDVTEIKKKELELEHARAEYQSLVDSLGDVVFKLDLRQGHFIFASAAAAEFFGRPVAELLGARFLDFVAPEDREMVKAIGRRKIDSPNGSVDQDQFRVKVADGTLRHVEVRVRNAGGEPGHETITGVIRDVEDHTRLEQALELGRAEQEQARARYQSLVDSLSDVVYAVNDRGIFTYVSPAAADLLGAAPEAVLGTRFRDWVVAEDVSRVMEAGRAFHHAPNDAMRQLRFRLKRADGTERPVELRYRKPVGEGRDAAQVGVIRDISELEQARIEYQSLVDSLADVSYTLDVETGLYTFVSASCEDLFGLPPDKILGHHFLEFIAPQSRDEVARKTQRAYRPGDPGTFSRFCIRAADGQDRHVEVRARRRLDPNGRLISSGIIRDVEERVVLERRLEQETARLRSIVESSGAMIALVDRDLRLVMVNTGFTLVTGVSEADAAGRPLREILDCPLDRLAGEPSRFAVKLVDAEGRKRLIAVTATPVMGADGRMEAAVLLGVDDTERRDAEQALNDAERFATVGEMAGTMAHELSQPLQVINIACASAQEAFSDAESEGKPADCAFVRSKLDRIALQIQVAGRVVNDLRDFVRGAADKQPVPFDPATAVRNAVSLTAHGLRQAGAVLRENLADELPNVRGETGRLEQVLVNLINNARDAGGNSVSVSADRLQQGGRDFVRIAVEDTGAGIAPDVLPRLFVSFVTTKARGKGTGLGLRICRRIVEEMGGTITATNRAEGGARFELLLPAAVPTAVPAVQIAAAAGAPRSNARSLDNFLALGN